MGVVLAARAAAVTLAIVSVVVALVLVFVIAPWQMLHTANDDISAFIQAQQV